MEVRQVAAEYAAAWAGVTLASRRLADWVDDVLTDVPFDTEVARMKEAIERYERAAAAMERLAGSVPPNA